MATPPENPLANWMTCNYPRGAMQWGVATLFPRSGLVCLRRAMCARPAAWTAWFAIDLVHLRRDYGIIDHVPWDPSIITDFILRYNMYGWYMGDPNAIQMRGPRAPPGVFNTNIMPIIRRLPWRFPRISRERANLITQRLRDRRQPRADRCIAFLMATHPRLALLDGETNPCPAAILSNDVLTKILRDVAMARSPPGPPVTTVRVPYTRGHLLGFSPTDPARSQ